MSRKLHIIAEEWNGIPRCSGVYLLFNEVNQKTYVGQAKDLYLRYGCHRRGKEKMFVSKSIRKYGFENFAFYILEFCNISELDIRETFWIKELNSCKIGLGYNLKSEGNSNKGIKRSEETKAKMRASRLKWMNENPEAFQQTTLYLKKTFENPEIKAKWQESRKIYFSKPENIEKISQERKSRNFSGSNNPMFGKEPPNKKNKSTT